MKPVDEKYWQERWEAEGVFQAPEKPGKNKFYALDMFPYPSGSGLHVGHPVGYFATDILARFKRMRGFDVLHPMGWDAFGLPAEEYARKTGQHPAITTKANVTNFKRQIKSLGLGYDWGREVNTTDPDYFKWTQGIFVHMFERGLAYQAAMPVNWCPALGTVVANEEVESGVTKDGGHPVEQRPVRQWVLKITAYAERLLNDLDGLDWPESVKQMQREWIGREEVDGKVTYRLRDWLFSRQRYWGEPIPLLHELDGDGNPTGTVRSVPLHMLPVELPPMPQFAPAADAKPALERAPDSWLYVELDGKRYKRETNTMPQWAGSCWYYLRYMDPTNTTLPFSRGAEQDWGPVDLYVGGTEHACLHLLYARFWHKVMYDYGAVSTPEPFTRLVNQGMMLGADGQKMSKSRGNGVCTDEVVGKHGADALRLYTMFMGPIEQTKPWSDAQIEGCTRFLARVRRLLLDDVGRLLPEVKDVPPDPDDQHHLHRTVKRVTEALEGMRYNVAISSLMEFVNRLYKKVYVSREAADALTRMLSPLAPHVAEDLWRALGNVDLVAKAQWPTYNPMLAEGTTQTMAVQVDGKKVGEILIECDDLQQRVVNRAVAAAKIDHADIVRTVYVPYRIVNFVTKAARKE